MNKNEHTRGTKLPRKWIHAIYVGLIFCLLLGFYVQEWLASEVSFQGVWHYTKNIFLVIEGKHIQFIKMNEMGVDILFEDPSVSFVYKSIWPTYSYNYTLVRSTSDPVPLDTFCHPFNDERIHLTLYPSYGVIHITKDNELVLQLVKDNEMSLAFMQN